MRAARPRRTQRQVAGQKHGIANHGAAGSRGGLPRSDLNRVTTDGAQKLCLPEELCPQVRGPTDSEWRTPRWPPAPEWGAEPVENRGLSHGVRLGRVEPRGEAQGDLLARSTAESSRGAQLVLGGAGWVAHGCSRAPRAGARADVRAGRQPRPQRVSSRRPAARGPAARARRAPRRRTAARSRRACSRAEPDLRAHRQTSPAGPKRVAARG